MKKLKYLSKKERFRIKGLNNFIENTDKIAAQEFDKIKHKAIGPMSNEQIKDYGLMFRAGFLKAVEIMTIKLRDS